jgi:hypothetical protein
MCPGVRWPTRKAPQAKNTQVHDLILSDVVVHTANEGPMRIQYKCLVPIFVFSEMKLLFPK